MNRNYVATGQRCLRRGSLKIVGTTLDPSLKYVTVNSGEFIDNLASPLDKIRIRARDSCRQ